MSDQILNDRALDVWTAVKTLDERNADESYEFDVGPSARKRLREVCGIILPNESGMQLNRTIRSQVNKFLVSKDIDHKKAGEVYRWIVADWGGIHAGPEALIKWARLWHHHYADTDLMRVASSMKTNRVSSWSKVFAFAAPLHHAIYDSRVAAVLNIALLEIEENPIFHIPLTRNRTIEKTRFILNKKGPLKAGYISYIKLCRNIASLTNAPLLDIEATFFASAPKIAEEFNRKFN